MGSDFRSVRKTPMLAGEAHEVYRVPEGRMAIVGALRVANGSDLDQYADIGVLCCCTPEQLAGDADWLELGACIPARSSREFLKGLPLAEGGAVVFRATSTLVRAWCSRQEIAP